MRPADQRWLVIDGTNLGMRAVFAMAGKTLSGGGENTGPLLVFARMVHRYCRFVDPTHVAVCWDSGPSWRADIDPEYKANRPTHSDLPNRRDSLRLMRQWLAFANVYQLVMAGFEADDLVAGVVNALRPGPERPQVVMVSGDKDLLQLVEQGWVRQIRPTQGMTPEEELWDEARVALKTDVTRDDLVLANALVGDTSDNISGIAGIGPKRAASLVKASRGRIEDLMEQPRCTMHRDLVERNIALMDLRHPQVIPMIPDVPEFRPTSHDGIGWAAYQTFLRDHRLSTLTELVVGREGVF